MTQNVPPPGAPGDDRSAPSAPAAGGSGAGTGTRSGAGSAAGTENAGRPPVLIAGAGPVGLCTALALARFGVPSVILEAQGERDATYFRTAGSKAICFQRDVLDVFDRLGVAAPLLAEGTTWTTARTYYREHEIRTVSFAGNGAAFASELPPWINVSQARVEQELLSAADAEPLITLRFGCAVTALEQDAEGVVVHTEDAPRAEIAAGVHVEQGTEKGPGPGAGGGSEVSAAGDAGSGRRTHRGSHLVGADGSRSAVRRLLGIEFPGESYSDRFLICDIRADLPFPNERRFHFDPEWNPGRQVLVHQCPDSTWRIDWQVPDDYDPEAEAGSGALEARIRKIVGDRPYEIVWSSVYRFHERCAERLRAGRVFLAGDAAHLFAPFGARGLNSGVHDAENVAWKLAVARGSADQRAVETLLDSYHVERHAAALENLAVTGATMRFLVPRDEAQWQRRRETLEAAVTDPEARARIDSGKLAEPFTYTRSALTSRRTVESGADLIGADGGVAGDGRAGGGSGGADSGSGGAGGGSGGVGEGSGGVPASTRIGPADGAICPDGPCRVEGRPDAVRLRRLFGPGFTVLTADAARAEALTAAFSALTAPAVAVAVYALDTIDPDAFVASALGDNGNSTYVIRPDAHLCAVVAADDIAAAVTAVRRACGHWIPDGAGEEGRRVGLLPNAVPES